MHPRASIDSTPCNNFTLPQSSSIKPLSKCTMPTALARLFKAEGSAQMPCRIPRMLEHMLAAEAEGVESKAPPLRDNDGTLTKALDGNISMACCQSYCPTKH
eukprot:6907846-Pyramimonas_sp.AAC.1